jgi:hypothetical protein
MASSEFWGSLRDNKELLVNGLDLLSFVLVTPELVRVVRPAISRGVYNAFLGTLLVGGLIVLFRFCTWLWLKAGLPVLTIQDPGFWIWREISWVIGDFLQILLLAVVLFVAYPFRQPLIDAGSWLAARTFPIGVMIFFVSRVIAFLVAAHERLGGPG